MGLIVPRPYQEDMISCAMETMRRKSTCLIKAATGAGKTIVFAELIRRWLNTHPKMKILVIVHREVIVRQNADKLLAIWPTAPIGIACASINQKIDMEKPVVFGSIQTLASRVDALPMFHLVIIDEAHRLPPKTKPSQYKTVLDTLAIYFPKLRIFGLTATPFRLNWGNIYGREHKRTSDDNPSENWFDELDLDIGMKKLMNYQPDDDNPDAPYLCGMRAFVEDSEISEELKGVKKTGGDYNQKDLSALMSKSIHLQTALDAYRKYKEDRKRCVIFAVDISHAERLKELFCKSGIPTGIIHSKQKKDINRTNLKLFESGNIECLVNVGVLVEGWDCKSVDLILLCRATMSAALFVQIIGRGLRTYPGKKDVLVLDLSGNFDTHGAPWDPKLPDYSHPGRVKKSKITPEKVCPNCGHANKAGVWCCENCGEILRVDQKEIAERIRLKEINLDKLKSKAAKKDFEGKVFLAAFSRHLTARGDDCLKISLTVDLLDSGRRVYITHFYRLDGKGRFYFERFWKRLTNLVAPDEIREAIKQSDVLASLDIVTVYKDGRYWKVRNW